jgi:hypothetical protein
MKLLRYLLAALALCLLPISAQAAACGTTGGTCYWSSGSGNWSDTTKWFSATSGSTPCSCVPAGTASIIILDGTDGSGTLTIDSDITVASITMSASTLSLDATTHNVTFAGTGANFTDTGTGGTHTVSLGSGTWTMPGVAATIWDAGNTNMTLAANTATLSFTGTAGYQNINLGGKTTYNTISLNSVGKLNAKAFVTSGGTIATLNITAPCSVNFAGPITFTNAQTWSGTSANLIVIAPIANAGLTSATFNMNAAGSTGQWMLVSGITFTTNTFAFTNSYNLGSAAGTYTLSNPSGGTSGGYIIGGG